MEFILESTKSLSVLDEYMCLPTFLGIVPLNDRYHPKLNGVSALYLGFKGSKDSFIIPIQHSECNNFSLEEVIPHLKRFKNLYTVSRKEALYYLGSQSCIDISLIALLLEGTKLEFRSPVSSIDYFYRVHSDFFPINSIIPILKLHEKWEHLFNSVKRYMGTELPEYFNFYNTKTINVYYLLEQSGLTITDNFLDYYTDIDYKYNLLEGKIYTWYNPYTITTRPSNTFNRINFAALNKESGVRNEIVPEFDYLVEFDYDGSHVRILCDQIGYELASGQAHEQLAHLYFPNQKITPELYEQSKKITFNAFYGSIPDRYKNLEIFKKLQEYLIELEETYSKFGYLNDSYTGRPIHIEGDNPSISKLLNYTIQSLEASRNVGVLEKLLKYLNSKKSNLILYTYDSFLIDFSKEDGKIALEDIGIILSENNKYPVKFKYGKSLNL
jgi:hypothetical protein